MEFFPATFTRDESDAAVDRIKSGFAQNGWGLWAVDVNDPGFWPEGPDSKTRFIGFVGLTVPRIETHFTPCVEIGWRLAHHAWGHGFATEAAHKAIEFGFQQLRLPEIVSYTSLLNTRSLRVMQRLKMTNDPRDDFDHPLVPPGHRLVRHALYRLSNPAAGQ
jgi:ribosomal-protein-alanine N-acetyltransferase